MNVSECIIKYLENYGPDTIFGYPGGGIIELFRALKNSNKLKFVLSRHEQGAVFEAQGYARASGKVGVAIVSSGPAATNALTGIADAYLDNIPIVVICGQADLCFLGKDEFQEVDTMKISKPIVKKRFQLRSPNDAGDVLRKAFETAVSGRPGPTLIDLPLDVSYMLTSLSKSNLIAPNISESHISEDNSKIKQALSLIKDSKRPMILIGGGIISANASESLMNFSKKTHIPIVSSVMGKGAVPSDYELFGGFVGTFCDKKANKVMQASDLLIVIGCRLTYHLTGDTDGFVPDAKIIHIDIDSTEISKNKKADITIIGNADAILKKMIDLVDFTKNTYFQNKQETNSPSYSNKIGEEKKMHISPTAFLKTLSNHLDPENSIITTGVGQHQIWSVINIHRTKPRSFLTSGGLGTMGFDLPAAIGAYYACPDKQILCVAGDGSIQMNIQEMATANEDCIPVKIIVMNNRMLGMIFEHEGNLWNKQSFAIGLDASPDYVKLAEAYHWRAKMISYCDEIEDGIKWLLNERGPCLLEVRYPGDSEGCMHLDYV